MPSAKGKKPSNPRVPRTRAAGTMTEAAFWAWLRSSLRRMSQRWRPLYGALNDAKRLATEDERKRHGGRLRFLYQCAECKGSFPKKEVEVDHIVACGSLKSWDDVGPFLQRLLCEKEGLRVVCKACHRAITNEQRRES